jgi:UDP-glucose 4-epimerase
MNVLVTGGAGFIGANLVRMLLQHNYQVTVLDNLSTGRREYLDGLPIECIQGDILDADLVKRVVPGHEGIVHLAAQTGVPGSLADPRRDCQVNVIGTLNMLEAARAEQERTGKQMRFVFASSNAPLGRQMPPATEDKAPLPISPYGASKLAGEGYCLAYHGSWGLGTVVLRFGNVYGPYSGSKNSVVAKFFKDILSTGAVTIDGDGEQTRDLIYVDDLCQVILLALQSNASAQVFQVATGIETSIIRLAYLIQEIAGHSINIRHTLPRQGDIRKNYSAIAKVHQILGWSPQTDLLAGLQKTADWFHRHQGTGSIKWVF